ncbi:MAG: hypothetical protein KKE62_14530 [Proteobacteria bacterium]|nr:hypothetical protein [Pseudomonadota bacterium]MBU1387572.1 hypothetical protein [Pseudomonadota bacterium]MBU1544047.1 hypothetical protein [Pseudomonadota bacterium]MBU2431555.1 hypothetical protein [Pseudomonadota bacterium]MBU2479789.1 hypothetical protein [Pseudomonadota bacterium]
MKTDKKKLAAAIAAVYAHLSTTGQAGYAPSATEPAQAQTLLPQVPAMPLNIWGMSGRQTQMQANSMMQWRAFK